MSLRSKPINLGICLIPYEYVGQSDYFTARSERSKAHAEGQLPGRASAPSHCGTAAGGVMTERSVVLFSST